MEIKAEFTLGGLDYSYTLPKKYTWNQLKKREFAFKNGWRVPYRHELIKLFDEVEASRDGEYLWSASSYTNHSVNAWVVVFVNGYSNNFNRTFSYNVRLVREISK
jgi:hypothetical protein